MVLPAVAAAGATYLFNKLGSSGSGRSKGGFLSGNPAQYSNVSTLDKSQQPLFKQFLGSAMNPGAGGAFGQSADYYRDLLSDNPQDMQAFAAPEMRRFNEEIIPQIGEQFAGMGSGGLNSSGFRNAALNAGTDLSERLGAIRANLRSQGAAGLQNIGRGALGNFNQSVQTQQSNEGFLSKAATGIGNAATQFGSDWLKNRFGGESVGKNSSPYGSNPQMGSSATPSAQYQLPNFNSRLRG